MAINSLLSQLFRCCQHRKSADHSNNTEPLDDTARLSHSAKSNLYEDPEVSTGSVKEPDRHGNSTTVQESETRAYDCFTALTVRRSKYVDLCDQALQLLVKD